MQTVTLAAVPAQTLSVVLGGQVVQLAIYQRGLVQPSMYMDLTSNGAPIVSGRVCRAFGGYPDTRATFFLTGRRYLGFQGDFVWMDTQAAPNTPTEDPQPDGLGVRWQLVYYSQADLQAAGLD